MKDGHVQQQQYATDTCNTSITPAMTLTTMSSSSSSSIDDKEVLFTSSLVTTKVSKFEKQTRLLKRQPKSKLQPLRLSYDNDIQIDRIIGTGGFATVSLASIPRLDQHIQCHQQNHSGNAKRRSTTRMTKQSQIQPMTTSLDQQKNHESSYRYAIKCSKRYKTLNGSSSNEKDIKRYIKAAQDIRYEVALLTRLNHENIISIYGIVDDSSVDDYVNYFFVMPHMKYTLDKLLQSWEREGKGKVDETTANTSAVISTSSIPSLHTRLSAIALGIANGMKYLHQNRILYRDLKPTNIGIDFYGNIKLFDFGISTELQVWEHQIENECIGSLRYMAPEILIHRQCNFTSDVYSYGIVLYQIVSCCGTPPYSKTHPQLIKLSDFRKEIGYNNLRPSLESESFNKDHDDDVDSTTIKRLIEDCWNQNQDQRPTFRQVVTILKKNQKKVQQQQVQSQDCRNNRTSSTSFWNNLYNNNSKQQQHRTTTTTVQ